MADNIVDYVARFSAKKTSSFTKAQASMGKLKAKIAEINKKKIDVKVSKQTTGGISTLAKSLTGLAVAVGAVSAVKSFFGLGIQAEQVSAQYEVLLGSASKAKAKIEELQKFASETPLSPEEVLKSGKALIAFGIASDTVVEKQRMIGDIAKATGKDFVELSLIYGKARASGKIYAEDLNQLTEAGIPILDELGKVMGVTAGEIKKLASEGKIGFDKMDVAMQNMTKSGGRYNGMMATMANTTAGKWTKLTGSVQLTLTKLSEKFAPVLNMVIDKLAVLWKWMENNGEILQIVAMTIGIVTVAWMAYSIATAIATTTTTAFSIAMGILDAIMVLNPVGLVVAGIMLLVGAFVLAWNYSDKFREVLHGVWSVIKLVIDKVVDLHMWIAEKLVNAFSGSVTVVGNWMTSITGFFSSVKDSIVEFIMKPINEALKLWKKLKGWFSKTEVGKVVIETVDKVKTTYQEGVARSRAKDEAERQAELTAKASASAGTPTKTPDAGAGAGAGAGTSSLKKNVDNRASGVRDEIKNVKIEIGTVGDFNGANFSIEDIPEFENQMTQALLRIANSGNAI